MKHFTFLIHISSCFALFLSTWGLFSLIENTIRPDIKKRLSNWLLRARRSRDENWSSTFSYLLESYFGKNYVTWKAFGRSILMSCIFLVISSFLVFLIAYSHYFDILSNDPLRVKAHVSTDILNFLISIIKDNSFTILIFAPYNFLVDFISMLETRYFVSFCKRIRLNFLIASIFDAAVTLIIFVLFFNLFYVAINFAGDYRLPPEHFINFTKEVIIPMDIHNDGRLPIRVFFISTFFASILLWIFTGTAQVIRYMTKIAQFLDVEKKPLHSMGLVAALLTVLIYITVVSFF